MKKTLFWILAVVITLASAYYQRRTGPTHPKRMEINISDNITKFKLPRSGDSNEDLSIEVPMIKSDSVLLNYRRYPLNESFTSVEFKQKEDLLFASLPKQSPAGKLEYYVSYEDPNSKEMIETEYIVTRFKGTVPAWALIPHILLMFVAMLLSNLSGIFAFGKVDKHVYYGNLTFILFLLGGMIFGPIVQYYAFGEFWTGIPFGWDLTDNKTLIAVVFWLIAVLGNRKNPKYRYTIIASIVLFLIYIIPHSVLGSELDHESGEIMTGFINLLF